MHKSIEIIQNFWLDFYVAYLNRLKKNGGSEPEFNILMHVSFVQSVNCNTIIIITTHWTGLEFVKLWNLMLVFFVAFIFNIFYFKKIKKDEKNLLFGRTPKYSLFIYTLYSLFSTIVFFSVIYLFYTF